LGTGPVATTSADETRDSIEDLDTDEFIEEATKEYKSMTLEQLYDTVRTSEINLPLAKQQQLEARRHNPRDGMWLDWTTLELKAKMKEIEAQAEEATQRYFEARDNFTNKEGASDRYVHLLKKKKYTLHKLRAKLRREIWRRDDRNVTKLPHQRHKREQGGGDLPEHTYMKVLCNDHPRWVEDDGLPGHFVRDQPGEEDKIVKLHWLIRSKFPKDWDMQLYREPRTVTFRINWGVHNNTETVKALLHWFERQIQKTGDQRAMLQFGRQYRLWYTRKLAISKLAQEAGLRVIWPIRSRHLSRIYILQRGFKNRDDVKEFQKSRHLYSYPMEKSYLEAQEITKEKFKRNWEPRVRSYNPKKECLVPYRYKLPIIEAKFTPIRLAKKVSLINNWLDHANLSQHYQLEQLKYIVKRGLVRKAFPPDADAAIRKGEIGHRMWKAVFRGDANTTRKMLELRPDVVDYVGHWGEPTVFTAARMNKTDCLKVLLEYGAKLDVWDQGEFTRGKKRTPALVTKKLEMHYGNKLIMEEIARREALERAAKGRYTAAGAGERVFGEEDEEIDIGAIAKDVQAMTLTRGASKVLRCSSCTMPLPAGVRLPYNCRSCGFLQQSTGTTNDLQMSELMSRPGRIKPVSKHQIVADELQDAGRMLSF